MPLNNITKNRASEGNSESIEKWGYTQVKVGQYNYVWTISNFSFCTEELGEMMQSPMFTTGVNDELKWCLDMYPKGHGAESQNYLSLFLSLVESTIPEVKAKFRFSIVDTKMMKTNSVEIQQAHTFVRGKSSESHGYTKFVSRGLLTNRKNELLPDDTLTLCCEVTIVTEVLNVSRKSDETLPQRIPNCQALDDFGVLLENEKFSDVTLVVREREFRAHKAILTARSPVFSAMFEHDMTELKKNWVEISEMDADVFQEMLRYIYTGKVKDLNNMADGLLAAADKYDLKRLKALSEEVLCKHLAIENAADCLMLADLHCAERLKAQAIDFINRHTEHVMETAGFKSILAKQPVLIAEALRILALRKNKDIDELFEIEKRTTQLKLCTPLRLPQGSDADHEIRPEDYGSIAVIDSISELRLEGMYK